MKRLGALLLVLVLTLSVMPMGAMAANADSTIFLTWGSGDNTLVSMTTEGSNNSGATTWSDATTGNSLYGLAVANNATIDTALMVNYLIIDGGKALTVSPFGTGLGHLTVKNTIIFCSNTGPGSIVVQNGGKLTVGSTVFETSNPGKITIKISTSNASSTSAALDNSTPTSSIAPAASVTAAKFFITVDTGDATITNLALDAANTTITSAQPVTFMGNNTLQGDVKLSSAVNVKGTVTLNATTFSNFGGAGATGKVTVEGRLDVTSESDFEGDGGFLIDGGTVNVINDVATFTGPVTVTNNGRLNLTSTYTDFEDNLVIQGGTVMVNVSSTGAGQGASFTNVTITNGGVLDFVKNTGDNAEFDGIDLLSGGTMNVWGAITDTTSITDLNLNGGTLNVNVTGFDTGMIAGDAFTGILNANEDLALAANLTVNLGGTLKVKDTKTLNLNGKDLTITGVADFGTGGKLNDSANTGTVTITGAMHMKDPAVQVNTTNIKGSNFKGNGTIYTDHRTWFIRGYADPDLKYVGYSPLAISYGESILVNTPVLAPATSNYSGYGDFIINTSGLFSNFDPNESLYANNQKLEVGVHYDVTDKGGYAVFTIYESFMQSQSGPIVFRATFKNGYSGSTTVNAQSATIPAEIGVDAPKTGMSASVMGFVVIAMAIALAVVVRKVSVDS